MTHLLLMRHAKARPGPGQDHGELFSTGDEPLAEAGRRQAQQMGEQIAASGFSVDAVYASSMQRCQQTARLVAEQLDAEHKLRTEPDLTEIPYHEAGAGYDEILEAIVDAARRLRDDPDPSLASGTSWQQATGRFAEALSGIVDAHECPLVVAHGAQNRAWLTRLLDMPPHRMFFLEQDHACLNVVAYGQRHPVLQKLNLTPAALRSQEASLAADG